MTTHVNSVTEIIKTLAFLLKTKRKEKKISINQMASLIDISKSTFIKLEKGNVKISAYTYYAYIYALFSEKLTLISNLFEKDIHTLTFKKKSLPKQKYINLNENFIKKKIHILLLNF
jgi:DNA-binding XRE family transcriptional regulator